MPAPTPPDPDEQLSAEFDSGRNTFEQSPAPDTEYTRNLFATWQRLGDSLRAIPVRDNNELRRAVLQQIRSESGQRAKPLMIVTPQKSAVTSASRRSQWVALLTSAAAVLLVCASWMSGSNRVLTVANSSLTRLGTEVASLPNDWEVLVVTVSDSGRDGIPESFRRTAGDRGFLLHSLAESVAGANHVADGGDHPNVLMASGDLSSEVRGMLESGQNDFQIEMNPDHIGELSRVELLNKFAESMKTPTKSDEYFGEMFVVLSEDEGVVVTSVPTGTTLKEIVVADAANSGSGRSASAGQPALESYVADSDQAMPSNIQHAMKHRLSTNGGKPILVVFVKRKPVPPNHRSDIHAVGRNSTST